MKPNRSKHQRGARCIYRDLTARELDRAIDTNAELLAALKAIEMETRDGGNWTPAEINEISRAAIAKAEGR